MKKEHTDEIISMMNVFYHSPAVYTDGSDEIYRADVENCINDSPYLKGYVFEEDGIILGYSMIAKSFSTEFGKPCIWIEDIYLKPDYRDMGIGSKFISFVSEKYSDAILRLEVEEENERAVHVYQKSGFTKLPYVEMKK
ncbi:MAG: GNAT family N-acetyltransferase [Acutalibacteraceae bacterium]